MFEKLHNFIITRGLTDDLIHQLIANSHEDHDVVQFTRDAERFASYESTKKYLDQAQVYALIDNAILCGIIWFQTKPLPDKEYTKVFDKNAYSITFAIRLYGEAKGKKLAIPFMEEAFSRLKQKKEDNLGFWLQTRADNSRAIHLYQKFGFEQVSEPDNENRIIMIKR